MLHDREPQTGAAKLAIVKHLVAKIGGSVTVDSDGEWTRFQVRMPRTDSPKSDTRVSPS